MTCHCCFAKVAVGDISLDELKSIAKELKLIRPVENIISAFVGEKWNDIESKLPEDVTSEQLRCFAVSCIMNFRLPKYYLSFYLLFVNQTNFHTVCLFIFKCGQYCSFM